MMKISKFIKNNEKCKCIFLPLISIDINDIDEDMEVTKSYEIIKNETGIGNQYEVLSKFAKQFGLTIELGLENNPLGRIKLLFKKYGVLRDFSINLTSGGSINYCELDKNKSSKDLLNLFGNFRFGLPLFNLTKLDIVSGYNKIGYEEVICMTWFCAHPIIGRPSGLCHPCEIVMKTSIGFRLPLHSRLLYNIFKATSFGRALDRRLKSIYNKRWRG